eukprot:m.869608 g.869608  ORF g.869608 m.869608 type:complete len:50 (+) comp59744_c0_seq21:4251-4400(+)
MCMLVSNLPKMLMATPTFAYKFAMLAQQLASCASTGGGPVRTQVLVKQR